VRLAEGGCPKMKIGIAHVEGKWLEI